MFSYTTNIYLAMHDRNSCEGHYFRFEFPKLNHTTQSNQTEHQAEVTLYFMLSPLAGWENTVLKRDSHQCDPHQTSNNICLIPGVISSPTRLLVKTTSNTVTSIFHSACKLIRVLSLVCSLRDWGGIILYLNYSDFLNLLILSVLHRKIFK